jgi:hypothetical protein
MLTICTHIDIPLAPLRQLTTIRYNRFLEKENKSRLASRCTESIYRIRRIERYEYGGAGDELANRIQNKKRDT